MLWVGLWPAYAQANLPEWVRFIQAGGPLQEVFFRPVALPLGAKLSRRPPLETRAALTKLIENLPQQADLYALRAREAERALDFADAEVDWKTFAALAADPVEGHSALANFYHRRLLPEREAEALLAIGRSPAVEAERFFAVDERRSWKAFEQILNLVEAHALPVAPAVEAYRAWLERYPAVTSIYRRFFDFLLEKGRFAEAKQLLSDYEQRFPADQVFAVQARAELTRRANSEEQALGFYENAFDPLWPATLIEDYFATVKQQRSLLDLLGRARESLEEDPENLAAAAKIFYYYQYHGNMAAAESVLFDYRLQKQVRGASWNAGELRTLAKLFAGTGNPWAAACHYYQAYSLAPGPHTEQALADLIELLSVPRPSLQTSPGDESSECDSLGAEADDELWTEIRSFLAAAGGERQPELPARLLETFEERFPQSPRRAALHVELLDAYAAYGNHDRVIAGARLFLEAFEDPDLRAETGLLLAGAHAGRSELQEEFAVYDSLLQELASGVEGVPLGRGVMAGRPRSPDEGPGSPGSPRSARYARVLDRYISRLMGLGRADETVVLYAREIDRNPNDQGLYSRLADFLSEHGLETPLETLYHRAIERFSEPYWYHKLARWYLRQQNHAEFERLTREAFDNLTGVEIEVYFEEIVEQNTLEPAVYLQINLGAHERFPFSIAFVRNLVDAYAQERTRNDAAREELLRQYWFYDEGLRARFFEVLSDTRKLDPEREQLRAALFAADVGNWQQLVRENPAAGQFLAETEILRSRFEPAVPLLLALVNDFPADDTLVRRAASVCRTLALANPLYVHLVAGIEEGLHQAAPRDRNQLARLGDLWADLEEFDRAKVYWEKMAAIKPGEPAGYLQAAAAFENYGLVEDALRVLEAGNDQLTGNPALFAYQTGALYEKSGDTSAAIAQYLQGALASEGDSPSRERLVALSKLPAHLDLIEQAVLQLTAGRNPRASAVELRAAILRAQGRRDELAQFLLQLIANTTSLDLLTTVASIGLKHGVDAAQTRVVERQIEMATDPAERARLQLFLLGLFENRNDTAAMERVMEEIYGEHTEIADAVRDAVDLASQEGNFRRALEILSEAGHRLYPQLNSQPTLAAAQSSTDIGGFEHARVLLQTLLAEEPFSGVYLAAMAETYDGESRYAPLRDFYEQKLAALENAPLPATEKSKAALALRRGLMRTLTELGDHPAATAQYVAMINEHPEDHNLVAEAARYADAYNQQEQLLAAYREDAAATPAGSRRMLLSRLQAYLEDLSAPLPRFGGPAADRFQRLASLEPTVSLENLFEEVRSSYQPRGETPTIAESPAAPSIAPAPAAPRAAAPPATAPSTTVESTGAQSTAVHFFVQTGAFKREHNALQLLSGLQEKGYPARRTCGEDFERVLVGPYDARPEAMRTETRLSVDGYDTWVRRLAYRENVKENVLPSPAGARALSEEGRLSERCIEAMSYEPLGRP